MLNRVPGSIAYRTGRWPIRGADYLLSGTFSAVASLDIVLGVALTAKYRAFKIFLTGVIGSAAADIWVRTSTNAGSSYDAAASDYAYCQSYLKSVDGTYNSVFSTAAAQVLAGFYNATVQASFEYTLWQPSVAAKCIINCFGAGWGATDTSTVITHGYRAAAADVDAIRFLAATGTFTGNYAVHGLL